MGVTNTTTTTLSQNKPSKKGNTHSLDETCLDNVNTEQISTSNFDQIMLFPPKLHRKHTSSDTLSTTVSVPSNIQDDFFPQDHTVGATDTHDPRDVVFSSSMASNLDMFKSDYISPQTNGDPRQEAEDHRIQW